MKKEESAKKSRKTTIFLAAYISPRSFSAAVSDSQQYWNSLHQSEAIAAYMDAVEEMDSSSYEAMRKCGRAYNAALPEDEARFHPGKDGEKNMRVFLILTGTGIMGYVNPRHQRFPAPLSRDRRRYPADRYWAYRGFLPPRGRAGHPLCYFRASGPSLIKAVYRFGPDGRGDIFILGCWTKQRTYEVDQIRIISRMISHLLALEEGKDYCTLVTCTPYGVNSHRLLVRGHRIETRRMVPLPGLRRMRFKWIPDWWRWLWRCRFCCSFCWERHFIHPAKENRATKR